MHRYVILHNIRSAHNVGSIFRTADGAGVSKIFLTGYTPAPTDRFGRPNAEIIKTSLGATESVLWETKENIDELLDELRDAQVTIVAIEQYPRAVDYRNEKIEKDTAFILGNEVEGVAKEICEKVDAVWHIPMHGMKESLNVSVATGIILFHTAD